MKRTLLFLYGMLLGMPMFASHIIGGNFELAWVRDNRYTLLFHLYFDRSTGSSGAQQDSIIVNIYKAATHERHRENIRLVLSDSLPILYRSKDCGRTANWNVARLTYRSSQVLLGNEFPDAQGYYAVWERCCRNNSILNIQSPWKAGATFYLQFPPLHQAKNSSPSFKPFEGGFACVNHDLELDFGATDADGDSLAYRLVTPINGWSDSSVNISPDPSPQPWPKAVWAAPFDSAHITLGTQPLTIDPSTGILRFNSSHIGIYLFAIECMEYRHGKPIGVAYRDYQLNITACPDNHPPRAALLVGRDSLRSAVITLPYGKKTCLPFLIKDKEASTLYTFGIQPWDASATFVPTSVQSGLMDSVATGSICFLPCFTRAPRDYMLIIRDNGCPFMLDTLRLQVKIDSSTYPTVAIDPPATRLEVDAFEALSFRVKVLPDSASNDVVLATTQETYTQRTLNYQATALSNAESLIAIRPLCEAVQQAPFLLTFRARSRFCTSFETNKTTVEITVKNKGQMADMDAIPNIITPNGDGINDAWDLRPFRQLDCGNEFVKLKILNRWGGTVFDTANLDSRWDAATVPDGVYFYEAQYQNERKKGLLQVLR